jgi:hypothetical protein
MYKYFPENLFSEPYDLYIILSNPIHVNAISFLYTSFILFNPNLIYLPI